MKIHTMEKTYLAIDLGGGSGRVVAGSISGDKLFMEEIIRFPNRQITLGNHIYWDFLSLFEDIKIGLKKAAQQYSNIVSIAVDTWGVDFGLVDKNGDLLSNPICYRDGRTNGMPEEVFKLIDEETYYAQTGTQIMSINTIFQLYYLSKNNRSLLDQAHQLMFMPDLFSYYLSGIGGNEYCIASTSGLLDAYKKNWAKELINRLDLPEHIFGNILQPGSIRGKLRMSISEECGLNNVDVVSVGSHDTASAVMALPTQKANVAFLSSGTWSLLGVLLDKPILTEEARKAGFTNEGGVGGKIRFLQNITGLWILQRLMNEWAEKGEKLSYTELVNQAEKQPCLALFDVDNSDFMNPASMEDAIISFCEENSQPIPCSKGEIAYCVLYSLAKRYKQAVVNMNHFLDSPIAALHIIGGGSQNKLLNQLTANELNIPVLSGPVEATAIGNILTQAWAKGDVSSLEELHKVTVESAESKVFYPQNK